MNKIILFLTVLFFINLFSSCSETYETKPITLTPTKYEKSVHLGKGVWILQPDEYQRAKSYDGFQTASKRSSISVKTSPRSVNDIKAQYSIKKLKEKNTELLQMSPVKFGEIENAFYTVVHDKRKNTIRYLLSVNDGKQTYNIKAFCTFPHRVTYEIRIKEALFSSYLGEEIERKELFKLAKLLGPNVMLYTKDGKSPTTSPDEASVEIETLESIEKLAVQSIVERRLYDLTLEKNNPTTTEKITNGKITYGVSRGESKKAYVALLFLEDQTGLLVSGKGNMNSDLKEFEDFFRSNFIKTTVGYSAN